MTSRASAIAGLAWSLALSLGCTAEPVHARAIWVDDFGGDGRRRLHVYDRGELSEFEVLGTSEPVERVRLDPRGRGILVRSGDRGAWFDLDDGRRLPLLLPQAGFASKPSIEFGHEALVWIDDLDRALTLVPVARGLPLVRDELGTIAPLRRGEGFDWLIAAGEAPIVFVAEASGGAGNGRASFMRYPSDPDDAMTISLDAHASGLSLPRSVSASTSCDSSLGCFVTAAVEPLGELAIYSSSQSGAEGPWELFDRRSPGLASPLELPSELADSQSGAGLRLLTVLDRAVSIWIGPGQLYRFDRAAGIVDSLPVFAVPPLHWTTADEGRALILSSSSGAVYRADRDGLRAVSVESTTCAGPSEPSVSPSGRWVAWTCIDIEAEVAAASGVVVRVSAAGLERFVGVPMATLAIDDAGDLLLYSVESSFTDEVDGVGPTSLPRSLFALSGDGALTRIDELEPAPTPVLVGTSELASYIQGVAL